MDASLVVQRTSRSVTVPPEESTALARNGTEADAGTVVSGGLTVTVFVFVPGPVYWMTTTGVESGGRFAERATTVCVPEKSTTCWSLRSSRRAVKVWSVWPDGMGMSMNSVSWPGGKLIVVSRVDPSGAVSTTCTSVTSMPNAASPP